MNTKQNLQYNKNSNLQTKFGNMGQTIIMIGILIQTCTTTLDRMWDLGSATDRLVGLSSGEIHLTYAIAPNNDPIIRQVNFVNVYTNVTTILTANAGVNVSKISEIKGTNTLSSNTYLVQYTNSQINNAIKSSNLTTSPVGFSPWSSSFPQFNVFGANTSIVYSLTNTNTGCKLTRNLLGSTLILQNKVGYTCYGLGYRANTIYSLMFNSSTKTVLITYHDSVAETLLTSHSLTTTQSYSNFRLSVWDSFYAFGYGTYIYSFVAFNRSSKCNITIGTPLYDLLVNDRWLYLSTSTQAQQYDPGSCMFYGYYNTTQSMMLSNHFPLASNPTYYYERLFLWSKSSGIVTVLNVQDRYRCPGGCTNCISFYQTDGNLECWLSGINHINAATTTPPAPNMPTTPPIVPPSSTPPSPVVSLSESFACFVYNSSVSGCEIYCDYKCRSCWSNLTFDSCIECGTNRVENSYGQCVLPIKTIILSLTANLFNTFRINSIQSVYYFLDNLELYQYHKTNYYGIIADILDQLNFIENKKWSLVPFECITDWTMRPYDNVPYQAYTNQKYLQIQRKDTMLFQTTKGFYTLFVPFAIVAFFCLNKLFYILWSIKISVYLRIYSFWLQLVVILVVSNSTKLCFLALSYFQLLFRFDSYYTFIHALSIFAFGFFIIALLSFFFLSQIFYGSLCRYFLINMYRNNLSLLLTFLRFSTRPLMQAALHVFLYNNPQTQILALSMLQLFFFVIVISFQLKFQLFKCKTILLSQLILSFSMIVLNLLILVKYFMFPNRQIIIECLEQLIKVVTMFMAAMVIIMFLEPLIFWVGQKMWSVCFGRPNQIRQNEVESEGMWDRDNVQEKEGKKISLVRTSANSQGLSCGDLITNKQLNCQRKHIYLKHGLTRNDKVVMQAREQRTMVRGTNGKFYKRKYQH